MTSSSQGSCQRALEGAAAGEELLAVLAHSFAVSAVAYGPDAETMYTGSWDTTVKHWDLVTGREMRTLYGHGESVRSLSLTPDGRFLASESAYGDFRIRDVAKQTWLHELKSFNVESESPHNGTFLAFSRDGETVARAVLGAKIVRFFNIRTGAGDRSVDVDAGVLTLSEDATKVMCQRTGGEVHVVELRDGRSLWTLSSSSGPRLFRAFALSAARAAAIDEAGDVGVMERRQDLTLALESLDQRAGLRAGLQQLQGHLLLVGPIGTLGEVDDRHAAAAELADDSPRPDAIFRQRRASAHDAFVGERVTQPACERSALHQERVFVFRQAQQLGHRRSQLGILGGNLGEEALPLALRPLKCRGEQPVGRGKALERVR